MKNYSLLENLLNIKKTANVISEAARTGGSAAQNEVALWCALKINDEMPADQKLDFSSFFVELQGGRQSGSKETRLTGGGIQTAASAGDISDVEFRFPPGHPQAGTLIQIEVKKSNAYSYDLTCNDVTTCPMFAKFDKLATNIMGRPSTGRELWNHIHGGEGEFAKVDPAVEQQNFTSPDSAYVDGDLTYNYKKITPPATIDVDVGDLVFDVKDSPLSTVTDKKGGLKLVAMKKKDQIAAWVATTSVTTHDSTGKEIENKRSNLDKIKYLKVKASKKRPSSAAITTSGLTNVEYSTEDSVERQKAQALIDAWNDHLQQDGADYLVIVGAGKMFVWKVEGGATWGPLENLSGGESIGPDSVESMSWGSVAGQPSAAGQARVGIKFGKIKTGVNPPQDISNLLDQARGSSMPEELIQDIMSKKAAAKNKELAADTSMTGFIDSVVAEMSSLGVTGISDRIGRAAANKLRNSIVKHFQKGKFDKAKTTEVLDGSLFTAIGISIDAVISEIAQPNFPDKIENFVRVIGMPAEKHDILDGKDFAAIKSAAGGSNTDGVRRTPEYYFITKRKLRKVAKTFSLEAADGQAVRFNEQDFKKYLLLTLLSIRSAAVKMESKASEQYARVFFSAFPIADSDDEPEERSVENSSRNEYDLPKLFEWAVK